MLRLMRAVSGLVPGSFVCQSTFGFGRPFRFSDMPRLANSQRVPPLTLLGRCGGSVPEALVPPPAEGGAYVYTLTASDPEGATVSWSVDSGDTCGGTFTGDDYGFTPMGP